MKSSNPTAIIPNKTFKDFTPALSNNLFTLMKWKV